MVYNENGEVAIKHYQTLPHVLGVSGIEYAFVVQHNICLAWIQPEDVDRVLSLKKTCCGGSRKPKYISATQIQVEIWEGKRVR